MDNPLFSWWREFQDDVVVIRRDRDDIRVRVPWAWTVAMPEQLSTWPQVGADAIAKVEERLERELAPGSVLVLGTDGGVRGD